jgi:hypothetical protein
VTKALAGEQKDTYALNGSQTWDATTRVATSVAEWPHPNAKLVVVFVGDEDDCSYPDDPSAGVVWNAQPAGSDSCVTDTLATDPAVKKQFAVSSLVDAFSGTGRPLGAAFIFPAQQTACSGTGCTVGPQVCCATDCPGSIGVCTQNTTCGGQAPGYRLLEAANTLRVRGAEVVVGSICDSNFGALLDQIAEIVKPPSGLSLPTEPAEGAISFLRVAAEDGQTRRTCRGPAPEQDCNPATQTCQAMTADRASELGYDWWFTANNNPGDPVAVSKFVYINHDTGNCEANPGETYSADYIALNPPGGCTSADDCIAELGSQTPWQCYRPPGTTRGTCVCGSP